MGKWAQFGAILRPTGLVIVAFAVWVGLRRAGGSLDSPSSADIRVPGPVSPEQLPAVADQLRLPKPELTPDDVARIQLGGLANPEGGGIGILQCYCFASPNNRSATGPLDRFGQMVRLGPFACLARPRATLVGKPQISGRFAKLLVTVVDEHQQMQAFTFVLFKQLTTPFEDCWMTEAVYPLGGLVPESSDKAAAGPDAA